jgi:uridine phosphorylase
MNSLETEETIINPRRGKREAAVAPRLLMTFTRPDYQYACQLAAAKSVAHSIVDCPIREGNWQGQPVVLAGPAPGAPYAVMVLEKLIALGVQTVMAFGWCGSLRSEVRIGDLVIPTAAYSEEGTSGHYPTAEPEPRPTIAFCLSLQDQLQVAGLPFQTGRVWTTDAIYRETKSKVLTYGSQGMLAVEMEMSALFTVARFRQVSLAGMLVVSDELFSLTWRHGMHDEHFRHRRQRALAAALDALRGYEQSGTTIGSEIR